MTLGLNAHATVLRINSVILNNETIIKNNEISAVHFLPYINTVDFIELNIGSRIESTDIKKIIFQEFIKSNSSRPGIEYQDRGVRTGGDGSGG